MPKKLRIEDLDGIGRAKLRHMQNHQPNLYQYLQKQGKLLEHLFEVQEQAGRYMQKADDAGRPTAETDEVIRETWISLPDIDDPEDAVIPTAEDEIF